MLNHRVGRLRFLRRTTDRSRRRFRRGVYVLPTLFTLGNLLSGFMAIFFASRTSSAGLPFQQWTALTFAAVFIFVGMVMDALDGRIARMTRSTSDMGAQLDSMATILLVLHTVE